MAIAKPVTPRLQRGHPLAKGLVGAWTMVGPNFLSMIDESDNGNTAIQSGGGTGLRDGNGLFGQCIEFGHGSFGGYYDCGDNSSLQITGNMSVSIWFISTLTSGGNVQGTAIAKDNDTGGRAFTLQIRNGSAPDLGIMFYINGGGGPSGGNATNTCIAQMSNTADGKWHHFVATYSTSGVMTAYLDGVQSNQTTGNATSINAATCNVRIGNRQYTGFVDPWQGFLDAPMIWNRALSPTEAKQLYFDSFAMFRPVRILRSAIGQVPYQQWYQLAPTLAQ